MRPRELPVPRRGGGARRADEGGRAEVFTEESPEFLCAGSAAEAIDEPERREEDGPVSISSSEKSDDWHDAKRPLDGTDSTRTRRLPGEG
jgi:hypothetical protein